MLRYIFVSGAIGFALYQIFRLRFCLYRCTDRHDIAISIASCFVSLTLPISIAHSVEHLSFFVKPNLQSHIVRIIWMVPVYSLKSYFSILFVEKAFYFQACREIYEAYVIYCFMRYLLNFLGDKPGTTNLADKLAGLPSALGMHKMPFCWLPQWHMGSEFLRRCKIGVFQYVLVRFLSTVLSLFLHLLGYYDVNDASWYSLSTFLTCINSLSQTWALYSLMLFYQVAQKPLLNMMPFYKFFCIKAVVFFTWWQSILLYALVSFGHINGSHGHSTREVGALIHDLLICIEMSAAALGFLHAFSTMDFQYVDSKQVTPVASAVELNLLSDGNKSKPSPRGNNTTEVDFVESSGESSCNVFQCIDGVRECLCGYSEMQERTRLDEQRARMRPISAVYHTIANKDLSKLPTISIDTPGESLLFIQALAHVVVQTELVVDLAEVATHVSGR